MPHTAAAVLAELEQVGTAQNRKVYRRHGVREPLFGVSYANLKALRKRLRTDHPLALALWASGNHDARVLAAMIADPARSDTVLLDAWADDLDNYVLTDAFSGYVGRTPLAEATMHAWLDAGDEWRTTTAWNLLAGLALRNADRDDAFFLPFLDRIEREIHAARNRVRYAMNNALIAIGIRNDALEQAAVSAAGHIGPVQVDHGETGCKTPDAIPYIRRARARKKR